MPVAELGSVVRDVTRDIARIPPQNLEAEQSTLGATMLSNEAIVQVAEFLRPEHFYSKKHAIIYQIILDMFNESEPVDSVTLTERLRKKDVLEKAGGIAYITKIMRMVPTAANVLHYARIVHEKAVIRNLITAATQIVEMGFNESENLVPLLDQAEQLIFAVSQKRRTSDFAAMKHLIKDAFELIEKMYERKEQITGVETGFRELDLMTAGLQNSDMIILAARTSMGKTSFALNVAANAALGSAGRQGVPVAVFSLEMSNTQLVQRMLSSQARIDFHRLRTGFLRQTDWAHLTEAAGHLSEAPIFIDDTPGMSLMEMRAKARRLKAEHDIRLLIIDYLQLIRCHQRFDNRQQEVAFMSRSLKALARELDVPVLALSQLSREADRRGGRPRLSDLRESGAIEQDSDLVVFLYRESAYQDEPENEGLAEIIIGKHRNGPTGAVELYFNRKHMRFDNLAKAQSSAPF